MYALVLGLWWLALLYFNPRFLALLIGPESLLAKGALLLFVLLSNLFWLYASYHLVLVGCAYALAWRRSSSTVADAAPTPPVPAVALLYTTCNDFQEDAARSHLQLDYSNDHLFLCDDSNRQEYQARVDAFARQHPDRVTVIRRATRTGFKAGNVNHALRQIGAAYEYFSLSDADTVLPPDYITALLPSAAQPGIAFAQARQTSRTNATMTPFARWMAYATDAHYLHYATTKNRFGFVMCYGHGALMRRAVWEAVGGFPEIATEDLAYSMEARRLGYEGVFVHEVVCHEEFPPTYRQYRKRNEKWIQGTMECLWRYYPAFLRAPHIPWMEKLDVLISAGSLLLALPFVLLLMLTGICLPLAFAHLQTQGPMLRLPVAQDHSLISWLAQLHGSLFWSWDVFGLVVATTLAPLVPAAIDLLRRPLTLLRYLAAYLFHFFALQVTSALHVVAFLLTRRAMFPVTGDAGALSLANDTAVFALEGLGGLLCAWLSLQTDNIWFLAPAAALLASPLVARWNFNVQLTRVIAVAPLAITCALMLLIGGNLP